MRKTIEFDIDRAKAAINPVPTLAKGALHMVIDAVELDEFNRLRDCLRKPRPYDRNPLVAMLFPCGTIDIISRRCCGKELGAPIDEVFDSVTLVGKSDLPLFYDSRNVIAIGDDEYVMGPVIAWKSDENGNVASFDSKTLIDAFFYLVEGVTTITIFGKDYLVFKL